MNSQRKENLTEAAIFVTVILVFATLVAVFMFLSAEHKTSQLDTGTEVTPTRTAFVALQDEPKAVKDGLSLDKALATLRLKRLVLTDAVDRYRRMAEHASGFSAAELHDASSAVEIAQAEFDVAKTELKVAGGDIE